MTVKQFVDQTDLWPQIENAVKGVLTGMPVADFLERVAQIPIRKSRATRSLGMYVSKAGEPICIRLQFAQEPEILKHTFLHEVAHACDHLSRGTGGQSYCRAHGPSWKVWARAFGISTQCCGESDAVRTLHQKRLKLVAVCQKCDLEFYRVRCLNKNRIYIHQNCGGKIQTV